MLSSRAILSLERYFVNYDYFSGSYLADDVRFLLKPIRVENTTIAEKEFLIQSGQRHYSEMLTYEKLPSSTYLTLFQQALADNQFLMAQHCLLLAEKIRKLRPKGITLVSLARAGTPVGVLLKRILKTHFAQESAHYSISIVRDKGIDENALLHILSHHTPESLVFVDGWTGKGVIAKQLEVSLETFAVQHGIVIPPELFVLADLSGTARISASAEDYLIPSSILNATVSGLISRSVLDKTQLADTDFHGCYFYQEYAAADLSNSFIETILNCVNQLNLGNILNDADSEPQILHETSHKQQLREQSKQFLSWIQQKYGISNLNLIKPGIGEATRVLLRREADILLLRDRHDASIQHLLYLAANKNLKISIYPELPYRAAALIKECL
jgi:Phosphoribosyl transferase (PRTase)/PELOTA RNA binding domain